MEFVFFVQVNKKLLHKSRFFKFTFEVPPASASYMLLNFACFEPHVSYRFVPYKNAYVY